MVTYAYTILYVKDVLKLMEFYETVFDFKRKFIAPGNVYGELITGSTTLSFAAVDLAKSNLKEGFIQSDVRNKPFAIEIGFATDQVQQLFDRAVKFGAAVESEPSYKEHGQTVAYVRDPEGFLIEICTPMS